MNYKKRWVALAALGAFFTFSGVSFADNQQSVKAGVVERSLNKDSLKAPQSSPVVNIEIPEEKEAKKLADSGQKVLVKKFEFVGNEVVKSAALQRLTVSNTQKELSFTELQAVCDKIKAYYTRSGYFLTQVYLPEQSIKDGVVKIHILEGRLGKIIVRGVQKLKEPWIGRHFAEISKKKVIQYSPLVRSLLILNEYGGLKAKSTFAKGEKQKP